jgi:hypothetical protein
MFTFCVITEVLYVPNGHIHIVFVFKNVTFVVVFFPVFVYVMEKT